MTDRWRIAIREAGHAVIARVLEINCGRCGISEDGSPVSFNSVTSTSSHEHVTGYRGRIIAERAGWEAEAFLMGSCEVARDQRWTAYLVSLTGREAPDQLPEVAERLEMTARGLVLRHAGEIVLLTIALWERGMLEDEAEIRAIAGLPQPEAWWLDMVRAAGSA